MIPSKEQCDFTNPEEHFLWALRNLPNVGGVQQIAPIMILKGWSEHLWECGFAHRDYLESLADEDGFIHVSQLPEQTKKFQPAARGPRHDFNPASQWVGSEEPEPEPVRIPDIRQLTPQENAAMLAQYRAAGMIPDVTPQRDFAQELN